jgi:hypothetical protein
MVLLISFSSFSQRDRRIGYTPRVPNSKPMKKMDPVKVSLDYLKKELTLDTFQEAATKSFLEETQREKEYILTLDISDEDKISKIKISVNKFDSQLNQILNKTQKDKFAKLVSKDKDTDKDDKKEDSKAIENQ